ncbi:MAG: bifunctional oligoribonuclease/PAP phosphatase NrnA [Helcococcus sp.]|nr:bifunctional oligoribonuclease/PAP phosphatase NrnA [Helcococcus sp.]
MKEKKNKLFEQIDNSNNILISAHVNPDGDAVGSSFGLAYILRNMGKNVYVINNDKFPTNLEFIYDESMYYNNQFEDIDLFIAIDSADIMRIGSSIEYFNKAKDTAVIDHHITNTGYSNNDIIYLSSSACEIVAETFIDKGIDIPQKAADYLYLGILTDTYRFQYSASTSNTLRVAAALIDLGARKDFIHGNLYERFDPNYLFLQAEVIQNATWIGDKIITAKISKDLIDKYNLDFDKSEGLVSLLITIDGVELSAIAKEDTDNQSKLSFRSQNIVDVSKLAKEFGGGGHMRASGATVQGSLDEVFERLNKRLEKLYEDGNLGN